MKTVITDKNPTGSFTPPPPSLLANLPAKLTTTFLISLLFAAALLFASCGDWFGDEDEDGDSSNTGDNNTGNNPGPMNPQGAYVYIEDNALPSPDINADVFMSIEGDDGLVRIPTPIGRITNGKLSFTLPDVSAYANQGFPVAENFGDLTRPADYEETETEGDYTNTYRVTKNTMEVVIPQDTKALGGAIGFVHEGREYWLAYGNETMDIEFYYFNKPVTLRGEFNTVQENIYTSSFNGSTDTDTHTYTDNATYNCTITAGWNVIYSTYTADGGGGPGSTSTYTSNMSTNPPANAATMRWIAYN
jgi:hypothetical protein